MLFRNKDTLRREGGHGDLWGFGNSPMEKGRWAETAISWDFGPGGVQWGSFRKTSQEEPGRERGRGVRGKSTSPNSPQGGLQLFSRRKYLDFS